MRVRVEKRSVLGWNKSYPDENNVVLNENSVEGTPFINRESKSDELTI